MLECALGKFIVIDISESGIRFALNSKENSQPFAAGDVLEGKLVFPERRGFVKIRGKVLRILPREVAVVLEDGGRIPLAKIMEEQRVLIQKGKLPS